ncbi:MAG: TIM barrel protein [Candidatus Aminicenantales bacterium]
MKPASEKLLFGTAGVPHSASRPSTMAGISRVAELGLDCLEIEFVMGMKMRTDLAGKIKKLTMEKNINLSVHAPYFLNLNSQEEGKRLASQERLLSTARMAALCGAENVVFHPGYYGKSAEEEACETILGGIKEVASILRSERSPVVLRPETMGKRSQFGSLEEILKLCQEVEGILPCIDFSHIHAREGKANSYSDFYRILKKTEKKLGAAALKKAHIHISGAEYGDKGELKHINLEESDFRYDEWIQVLKDFGIEGMVVCESPNLEKDALMLKKLFYSS